MKRLHIYLASFITVLATVFALNGFVQTSHAAGIDNTRDCDNTAIIHCGVMTMSELKTKFAANEAGDLPAIYKAFGVANFDGMVDGVVWRDGRVTVGGKTVATGAMTAARNMSGGAIAGSDAVVINPSVWPAEFITAKPAYVKMVNGQFAYAVLKTCGNPVKATPTPTPKPAPQPAAACSALSVATISRTEYEFTGTATVENGATVSGYVFTVKNASGAIVKTVTVTSAALSAKSGTVSLPNAGDYSVTLTVKTSLGDKTAAGCIKNITVPKPDQTEVCNPETGKTMIVNKGEENKFKPVGDVACTTVMVCNPNTKTIVEVPFKDRDQFKPQSDEACKEAPKVEGVSTIASTGPTDMIGGGIGLSSLAAAGYYFRASRRTLMNALRNR